LSAKHTPGPWVVRGADTYRWQIEHGDVKAATVVARVTTPRKGGTDASDANAHLIAAAPDMLDVLESILCDSYICDAIRESGNRGVIDDVRAAIKKARGEK
jgi:hypothetical protein